MPMIDRATLLGTLLGTLPLLTCFAGCSKEEPTVAPNETGVTHLAEEPAIAEQPTADTSAPESSIPTETPVAQADWLIVPGERVGPLTAASSATDLIGVFGAENIRDEPYPLGEGESEPGTVIFPDDPTRRMAILWNDLDKKARPLSVRIDGAGSIWKTAQGVTVGMSLKSVEALNGKPFRLYGFGWDYGGQLVESNGGELKDLPHEDAEGGFRGGALLLTFQPDPGADDSAVLGDGTFSSDHPVMQTLDPKISAIVVNFPDAG